MPTPDKESLSTFLATAQDSSSACSHFGISSGKLYRLLRRYGIPSYMSHKHDRRVSRVLEIPIAMRTVSNVADVLGVSKSTVGRLCRKYGISVSREVSENRILNMVEAGFSTDFITSRLGVSKSSVSLTCHRHGVKSPKKRELERELALVQSIPLELRTVPRIMDYLGCNRQKAWSLATSVGYANGRLKDRSPLLRMVEDGVHSDTIGESLGITGAQVRNVMSQLGLKSKIRGGRKDV